MMQILFAMIIGTGVGLCLGMFIDHYFLDEEEDNDGGHIDD